MITLMFKDGGDGGLHAFGFSTVGYRSSAAAEILKKVEEERLQNLLGQDWQVCVYRLRFKNNELVVWSETEDV